MLSLRNKIELSTKQEYIWTNGRGTGGREIQIEIVEVFPIQITECAKYFFSCSCKWKQTFNIYISSDTFTLKQIFCSGIHYKILLQYSLYIVEYPPFRDWDRIQMMSIFQKLGRVYLTRNWTIEEIVSGLAHGQSWLSILCMFLYMKVSFRSYRTYLGRKQTNFSLIFKNLCKLALHNERSCPFSGKFS